MRISVAFAFSPLFAALWLTRCLLCVKISKDSSGKDNEGSRLTTVQLWWKEFEQSAKDTQAAAKASEVAEVTYKDSSDPKDHWYGVSTGYWEKVEATDDGMLGGFAAISQNDIVGSFKFLLPLIQGTEPHWKRKVGTSKAVGTFPALCVSQLAFSVSPKVTCFTGSRRSPLTQVPRSLIDPFSPTISILRVSIDPDTDHKPVFDAMVKTLVLALAESQRDCSPRFLKRLI